MSRMKTVCPDGAPLRFGSVLKLYWVFAMQIGSLSKPRRVNSAIVFSASGLYSTAPAEYISMQMASILSLMGRFTSYRKRKELSSCSAQAATTAFARSTAPAPPSVKCSLTTASNAPASMASFLISSTSASVSVMKRLIATTAGRPYLLTFSMCRRRFDMPFSMSSRFSSLYSCGRGAPGFTAEPPPCILRARAVATSTTALGLRPL
mmetsp:Transcript_21936/g.37646  ORF Transcript_21936/g.37646 Transcript_21936/m.37646 type:complete len:207 (-) Transcript_21936:1494-2114(-)